MISIKQTVPFGLFSYLALLRSVKADDSTNNASWPDWVTNDYDCVIGCLSGFNDTITSVPQDALAQQAFDCTSSTCTGDAAGNYYQTLYYIQLFYATGSIYEYSDSAPDGYKHATFTDSTDAVSDTAVSNDSGDDDTADPTGTFEDDSAYATDGAKTTGSADGGDDDSATNTAAVAVDTGTENGAVVAAATADSTASGSKLSSASNTSSHSGANAASSNVAADISEGSAFKAIGGGVAQRVLGAVGAMVVGGVWIGL
ncbi:hypothetical protein J007_05051 [Cryptococcus neoformans]|nr:hypothetical protein J007_05051 [Cryptococcus neoformans var. grubii]OXC59413.1 hypothetical protein C358_05166 [Cryptococcus neoformans var. grubii MW-RSA852]